MTNTGDAGVGSGASGDLRYCLNQANMTTGANLINATGVTGTILTTSVLTIASSLTITGPADNSLVISGSTDTQVFTINGTGRTVVFKNLDITGGNTTASGGGVFAGPNTVTFDTDWIYGNRTTANGGGIASSSGATITVKNCAITANSAGGAGTDSLGRALTLPPSSSCRTVRSPATPEQRSSWRAYRLVRC